MNPRIKELAKQAGDYVNEVYTPPVRSKTPGKIWEDGHIGWHEQFHEKFAELIVRECLSVVGRNIRGPHGEYDYSYSDADAAADSRAQGIHDDIKYHFGIEE